MRVAREFRPDRWPSRSAFTLTELLVVVTVIVLLFTIIAPGFKQMMTTGTREAATSTIGVACTTIRTYATRSKPFAVNNFQGTAMIFTPANEIRFVESDEAVLDGSGNPLVGKTPQQAGYIDVPGQDYLQLPDDAGVVGITRGGSGTGSVRLYTTPFAVRFNGEGSIIARSSSSEYDGSVYYDGNAAGNCVVSSDRGAPYVSGYSPPGATYDPAEWDPTSSKYPSPAFNDTTTKAGISSTNNRYKLPFEKLDTVVGVILFSKSEALAAGVSLASDATAGTNAALPAAATTWITTNGTYIYFNRSTGAIIRP